MKDTEERLKALEEVALEALRTGDLPKYQDTLESGARARIRMKKFDAAAENMAQWVFIQFSAPIFGGLLNVDDAVKPTPPWHIRDWGDRKLPGKIINLIRKIPEHEDKVGQALRANQELFARAFRCEPAGFDMEDKMKTDAIDFDLFKKEN